MTIIQYATGGILVIRTIIGIVFLLLPALALASDWHCRNRDMEIQCGSGRCKASPADEFTPFDIRIKTDGSMDICAYSGCWIGKGKMVRSGKHIMVSGHKLNWTGTNPGSADFIVAIDQSDNVGFIKGEGFAMPIICSKIDR